MSTGSAYPASLYDATHTGTDGDVEFYRAACAGARSVLELGCGSGRIVLACAPPTAAVVGVDVHPELLSLARDRAGALTRPGSLDFFEGDMRNVRLGKRFDRVIIPYGGIFCLANDDELRACLETVRVHLNPGGQVILDTYAADGFHADGETQGEDARRFDAWREVKVIRVDGRRVRVEERSAWDRPAQRILAQYRYTADDTIIAETELPQRYLLAEQLLLALMHAELEPIALWGDFQETPFDPETSAHLVLVAHAAHPGDGAEPVTSPSSA